MFCRFCGAAILPDSRYCSKCGKALDPAATRTRRWLAPLRTPWPWAGLLLLLFGVWILAPDPPPLDLSSVAIALELEADTLVPGENLFRHYLSLVVENRGQEPIGPIPVEFRAEIAPDQPVEIVSEFRGGRYVVLREGESLPLILVLADEISPEEKRRFPIDNLVTTMPPADVTYMIRSESGEVLATLVASVGEAVP
jgi:predicted nucleic acid-binding Zn ribbon protein